MTFELTYKMSKQRFIQVYSFHSEVSPYFDWTIGIHISQQKQISEIAILFHVFINSLILRRMGAP